MAEHTGKMIIIERFGKRVKATLMKVGEGDHYRAAYIDADGKPHTTMVPFVEAEAAVAKGQVSKG